MAWTESELKRVVQIENKVNDLQTALNNVASRKQMKAILGVRQAEIEDIKVKLTGTVILVNPPASATSPGTKGDIACDNDYIYVCVATDVWVRARLSTW